MCFFCKSRFENMIDSFLLAPSSPPLFSLDRLQKNRTLFADRLKKPYKSAGKKFMNNPACFLALPARFCDAVVAVLGSYHIC